MTPYHWCSLPNNWSQIRCFDLRSSFGTMFFSWEQPAKSSTDAINSDINTISNFKLSSNWSFALAKSVPTNLCCSFMPGLLATDSCCPCTVRFLWCFLLRQDVAVSPGGVSFVLSNTAHSNTIDDSLREKKFKTSSWARFLFKVYFLFRYLCAPFMAIIALLWW